MKRLSTSTLMVTCAVLVAFSGALEAAQTPTAAATASRVELVVVVHQGEQPVEGLTAADFEVRQPGRAATVLEVERVADRQWMLLFDLGSPGRDWVPQARAAALDLVSNGLAATDRVGVAILGSDSELRVVQPTLDRSLVEQAIAAVPADAGQSPGVSGDHVASVAEGAADQGGLGEGHERGLAYAGQARVEGLAQSVQGLAGLLRAFGGNNHIVLLSSGVDLSSALGNDLTSALDQERAAREAEASAGGDITRRSELSLAQGGVVEQMVLQATEEAARQGCTVHGVEISKPEASRGVDGLWFLAERTGGEVVRDPSSLAQAFAGLLQRTSSAYRLTVLPAKLRKAGGFHPVKIKLANSAYEADAPGGFYAAGGS